jgi:hypothetical protein
MLSLKVGVEINAILASLIDYVLVKHRGWQDQGIKGNWG